MYCVVCFSVKVNKKKLVRERCLLNIKVFPVFLQQSEKIERKRCINQKKLYYLQQLVHLDFLAEVFKHHYTIYKHKKFVHLLIDEHFGEPINIKRQLQVI